MARVLVTGATGLLGSRLVPFLKDHGHEVIAAGHTISSFLNFDLINFEQTSKALDQVTPDIIINLTALTNVDRCERNPNLAYLLNVKTVENISKWITSTSKFCHLIQISTDQVYDGLGPHLENNITIRNHYAMSKLAAEYAAINVNATVLRTNFVGRSHRKGRDSLSDWLYYSLLDKRTVNVFDDVLFSPLSISSLCEYLNICLLEKPLGVFNLGSADGMSKADFAFAFSSGLGLNFSNLVRTDSTLASQFNAPRPTDMRMNSKLFESHMSVNLPSLSGEISHIVNEYL